MPRWLPLLWLTAGAFALAQPCLADPVTITGGSASLYWDGQLASFSLVGPGTSIVQDSRNPWGPTGFSAGSTVQFTGSLNPESTHGFQMTLNGSTYENVVLIGSASFATDSLSPIADGSAASVATALLLTGHFDAVRFGDRESTPLFSFDVNLPGVFSAQFDNIGDGMFLNRTFAASALFGDPSTPSETPEPTSVLLMGTPVVAFILRRIQQRFHP